jgi:hypothetical protein
VHVNGAHLADADVAVILGSDAIEHLATLVGRARHEARVAQRRARCARLWVDPAPHQRAGVHCDGGDGHALQHRDGGRFK